MHVRRLLLSIALVAAYVYLVAARPPRARSRPELEVLQTGPALAAVEPPATLDELRGRLAAIAEREGIPGVAIALVGRDGPLWVGGVGVRDRASRAPMEARSVFRVGSLSKSIVALGVMRLVDAGKLDLDRPVREIVPDAGIDNPWEDVAPVTLAQCMEHTAGFDDVRFNEIFATDERISVRETLALNPRSRRVRWRPGTRHAYSNVGYTIAARAIEVVTGEPFDVYLRREVLAPLGIVDADFARTPALAARLATGYLDATTPAQFHAFAHRPSGSLLASAADLARFVWFWIRRGEGFPPIVSREGLARIERTGTLPYPPLDADYGFANYGDTQHSVLGRGHDGGMPGFHSAFRYFPELGVGYVMLLNANYSFRGYRDIRALLYAYLTREQPRAPRPAPPARTEPPGADYFAYAAPRSELFAFIEETRFGWDVTTARDHVTIRELDGTTECFVPTADGGYRHADESGSSVRFARNRDGTPVLLLGFTYAEAAPGWPAHLRYAVLALAMQLLHLAPLWAAGMLLFSALQRRRYLASSLLVWPAIAGLSCFVLPHLLEHAFLAGVIGQVHWLTVAICGATIAFAIASLASLLTVAHWVLRPDRPRWWVLAMPAAFGIAFACLSVWLAANGVIGLRTWAH